MGDRWAVSEGPGGPDRERGGRRRSRSRERRRSRSREERRRSRSRSPRGGGPKRSRSREPRRRSRSRSRGERHHAGGGDRPSSSLPPPPPMSECVHRMALSCAWRHGQLEPSCTTHLSSGDRHGRGAQHHNNEPPMSDQPPAAGSVHQGSVHTVKHFGLFVSVPGYRRHILVHTTQVSEEIKFDR